VMGGTEALVDPQAGLAYDLESYDPSQISIPPAEAEQPCPGGSADRIVLASAGA
jgi:hypothetical protein